jgi:hypothetical protein
MICSNRECQKNIETPLILFDGRWICPFCKEDIFPNEQTEMKITNENHEKLLLSEKIFNEKWLLDYSSKDKSSYLKKAIKLCSESAFLNNPYITILLIVFLFFLGTLSFLITPKEENPQIIIPAAYVITEWPGVSAKEVELRISEVLEDKILDKITLPNFEAVEV